MAASHNPNPHVAEALAALRRHLDALLAGGYGRATFVLDDDGTPEHQETVITLPRQDTESLEQFICRVWANHKPLPHEAIEFSATGGRLTARITVRADGELADLGAQLAQLRQQVEALARHLEQSKEA